MEPIQRKAENKVFMNWSAGKDSSFSVWKYGVAGIDALLCTLSSDTRRISMHGVREDLLEKQALALDLPLKKLWLPSMPDMNAYEAAMKAKLAELKAEGFTTGLFGDLFLEDLKTFREKQYAEAGLSCVFPIWGYNTAELIREFVHAGFKAVLVAVDNDKLGEEWAGKEIDEQFLADLPEGVDPCGENGEYHTFVYDGPCFKKPVKFKRGEKLMKSYPDPVDPGRSKAFTFIDLISV